MLRQLTAKYFGLPLFDIATRSSVCRYYVTYKNVLKWGRSEIREFQTRKLRHVLIHAYEHVPFYRRRFDGCGFSPYSRGFLGDMRRIPFLTRSDIQRHADCLIDVAVSKRSLLMCSSSGTTGIPISYYKDRRAYSADIAATYMLWHMAETGIGARRLHIWGNPGSILQWNTRSSVMKRWIFNYKNVTSFMLKDDYALARLVQLIDDYRPYSIDGYTSHIYVLARYIDDNRMNIPRVKRVFTTAEDLYPHQREVIERVLGPVYDVYGCGEINGVAVQCAEGFYHIFSPRVFVEGDGTVATGRQIIMTDLENLAMPLIRYQPGDLFDGIEEDGDCPCGSPLPHFNSLHGRLAQVIELPNGTMISPISLFGGTTFRGVSHFYRHQTIWNGRYFVFNFEVDSRFGTEEKQRIEEIIGDILRPYGTDFRVRTTGSLDMGREKFAYFKVDHASR